VILLLYSPCLYCHMYLWYIYIACDRLEWKGMLFCIVFICIVIGDPDPSWSCSNGSWIYNFLCNQCPLPLKLWIRIPLMATGRWFSPDTPVSCINQTGHAIAEPLLKIVLNVISIIVLTHTFHKTIHCFLRHYIYQRIFLFFFAYTLTGQKYFRTKIFHIKPFIFKTFSWSHSLSDFH
jgi:hypothetical protein